MWLRGVSGHVTSAGVCPPRGGTPSLQSGCGSLQLLHHLQTESFNGPQTDPGPAGTVTRRRRRGVRRVLLVLQVAVCDGHCHRFVSVKQGLPPARARARGQHGAKAVGRGHLPHVRQRHGRARRQVGVRRFCRSAAGMSDPRRQAEQESAGGRGAERGPGGTRSRTLVIVVGQQSGPIWGAPVRPRREEEERTARGDAEGRDPLWSQN